VWKYWRQALELRILLVLHEDPHDYHLVQAGELCWRCVDLLTGVEDGYYEATNLPWESPKFERLL
jgi:hypothetical protein